MLFHGHYLTYDADSTYINRGLPNPELETSGANKEYRYNTVKKASDVLFKMRHKPGDPIHKITHLIIWIRTMDADE